MQKLAELCQENLQLEDKCKLEKFTWNKISNVTKAMWQKYWQETDGHKKYKRFYSLSKTFYNHYRNLLDKYDTLRVKLLCFFTKFVVLLICYFSYKNLKKDMNKKNYGFS